MKKTMLILALLLAPFLVQAEDHVTIAIRTNQFTTPRMVQFFDDLAKHVPPRLLSDTYHGIKEGCVGGQWVQYTNTLGHTFMVNNFRKSELETPRFTYQYGTDTNGQQVVTNTIPHGMTVNQVRLDAVRDGASQASLKMAIVKDPKAALTAWGLFARKDEELVP